VAVLLQATGRNLMRAAAVGEELHRWPSLLVSALELRRALGHAKSYWRSKTSLNAGMRRRALEAANRQRAETSTDGTARAPMPGFLQELPDCRRRLVERSAAGNHNTAILLPRRGKVLASKTPRCHRPLFSPSFGTVQGAWSARFASTASVIRIRCSCHRDYARISTEARYWAPFVKRSEPNEERWLSAELFSVRERRDARYAVMAELDPQHGSTARLLTAGVSGTGPLGRESGWNPGRQPHGLFSRRAPSWVTQGRTTRRCCC
jgi:hypothetical protein